MLLSDLVDTMLLAVAGALTYYFGGNALTYYINRKTPYSRGLSTPGAVPPCVGT